MKGSIIIVSFFIAGVLLGRFSFLPENMVRSDYSVFALYLLMFLVGISIGLDKKAINALRNQNLKIFLVPLGTIFGTWIGVAIVGFFMD